MRRIVLLPLAAALVLASASAAALQPVRRTHGDRTIPRVRAGVLKIPAGHASGRLTVLVDLRLPPLAASSRTLALSVDGRRLNVRSASSRAYLRVLAREQRVAAAQIRRAIPSARITHSYRVILNGFALRLPARRLPTLAALSSVTKIYPSLAYKLKLNKSPALIGANDFWASTGKRGEGVKIAVVDDGVDQTNPFFDPSGYAYPPGFPKGDTSFTTPKVIVAKSFPGPGSGNRGRLPVDRTASFHGTHVAGIAAGNPGTTAPAGNDHPVVTGLSGVAPRAWIGNYRVFNAPTPTGGNDAFTPEIVEAFEQAVTDGMNVINFSGGGPMVDPVNDAFVEAVRNVAAAGVVPVMAAGNDRDEFGLGSVGSPGTAPDAISVAAVSNTHVFSPVIAVQNADAPASLKQIPFQHIGEIPGDLTASDKTIVDVGTIRGTDGHPVERHLCGPSSDPNGGTSVLPAGSLNGTVALIFRGTCTFFSKFQRAKDAGAVAAVVVDNRPGEANPIAILPSTLPLDPGMISDLDGANLRDYLDAHGGRATIRYSSEVRMNETGRSGIVTSFSSGGPTPFGHILKPDLAAPGGQILSSTLPEAGGPFAVFDGTSMATPHVTGAAALVIQDHPTWSARQVKSALMSTTGPAWGNTRRTTEASVLLEGAGLVNVARADNPRLFLEPSSLSFHDLNVNHGAQRSPLLVTVDDAGGGGGTWSVSLAPQSATAGARIDLPTTIALPPGGSTSLVAVAKASSSATAGDDSGFIVLTRGSVVRRIPYYFAVTRPGIERDTAQPLQRLQLGDTTVGTSNANVYRFPAAPYGPPPTYFGQATNETGAEQVYVTHLNRPAANIGVAVVAQTSNSLIDPWFLGSPDENDVQGLPGTPINANVLTFEYQFAVEAAGALFPQQKRYVVSVDAPSDPFTGASLAGKYVLRSWVNDVTPPRLRLLTRRVTAGRPLLAAIATDAGAGVDPLSLVISYRNVLLGAAFYDPVSGLALYPIPSNAPTIPRGRTRTVSLASDYQESKNIDQVGENILPNSRFVNARIRGVAAPTATWLLPAGRCFIRGDNLAIAAGAPRGIRFVRFFDGRRRIATVRRGQLGLWVTARSPRLKAGRRHLLRAVVFARGGRRVSARHVVRVCRG